MKNLLFFEAKQTLRPPKNGGLRVTRLPTGPHSSNFRFRVQLAFLSFRNGTRTKM
jgi:hypothetical protein